MKARVAVTSEKLDDTTFGGRKSLGCNLRERVTAKVKVRCPNVERMLPCVEYGLDRATTDSM